MEEARFRFEARVGGRAVGQGVLTKMIILHPPPPSLPLFFQVEY